MDVLKVIADRRSIRKFKGKPITDEKIKTILTAAMSFGYADENPESRPRKPVDEVARWLDK